MRFSILFIAIVALLASCGSSGPSPEEIAAGKETYKKFCVACHGLTGRMQLNGAKDFTEAASTLEERINIITNGRSMMTPFKGILKEEEIKNVAAYTMKLTKGEQ